MKNLLFLWILGLWGFSAVAQENENTYFFPDNFASFNENSLFEIQQIRPCLSQLKPEIHQFGSFTLPFISDYYNEKTSINMMAIANAEALQKKRNILQLDFPTRQLQQIQSNIQVYFDQTNFNNRTNNDLNFYGRQTPDGGIKNEVYRDIRQPLVNPYYNLYRRNNRNTNGPVFYLSR